MGENKKIIVGITLGTRDLILNPENVSDEDMEHIKESIETVRFNYSDDKKDIILSPSRKVGKFLLDNYKKYKDKFNYPMVKAAINEIIEHEKINRDNKINQIFFICTDQDNEKFKESDSIYFGKIIKKILQDENKIKKFMENEIKIIKVKENVAEINEMNKFFKQLYLNKYFSKIDKENTKFYLLNLGGIPAINTAFLINSILTFKDNCIQLYIDKDTKDVYPLSFVTDLLIDIELQKIDYLLEQYNYVQVLNILEKIDSSDKYRHRFDEELMLLKIAKDRLYFNFERAQEVCKEYMKKGFNNNYISNEIKLFSNELRYLKEDEFYKIQELYFNTRIKYIQEQYVDFLLRCFRLEEGINRYIVEKYMNIDTENDKNNSNRKEKPIDIVKRNIYLSDYLDNYQLENKEKLMWKNCINGKERMNFNNTVFKALIEYIIDINKSENGEEYIKENVELDKIKNIYKLNTYLNTLSRLRNKSIGAHGYEGVSKEEIENTLNEKCNITITELFDTIEKVIDNRFEECFYNKINNIVRKSIRRIN